MAREIKFRGKYTLPFHEVGKPVVCFWVYGSLIMCCDKTDIVESNGNIRQNINPQTIGQFTGLRDKNGKEIYEGDIFHLGSKSILYQVVWHDTGLIGKQIHASCYAGLEHWKEKILVIGNIHDNPELLMKEA